jgi:hypothetical protein
MQPYQNMRIEVLLLLVVQIALALILGLLLLWSEESLIQLLSKHWHAEKPLP